jgi:D-erythrose 4-phosphate dehydrogenase
MTCRIAINGYGRIGRSVLRALYGSGCRGSFEVAAINDVSDYTSRAHLTKHDSLYGNFPVPVELRGDELHVAGDRIPLLIVPRAADLPWKSLGVDIVMDCTGTATTREEAGRHIEAGAGKVLLSYPGPADVDVTVVYGINHGEIHAGSTIVSNASCTTNCLIPALDVMDKNFGIEHGSVTVIHSVMNDQPLLDSCTGGGLRRIRSGTKSIVPVDTKLAAGIARIMPGLRGRFAALALRVPVAKVSLMDITLVTERDAGIDSVTGAFADAAENRLRGILGLCTEPLVSSDFGIDARSCIIDGPSVTVCGGRMVKLLAWFDNEWAFSVRMLDTALAMYGR